MIKVRCSTTHRWIALFALWCFFAWGVQAIVRQGATIDEQGFLVRGTAYVRGENRWMRVGHPAGLNAYNALLLAFDQRVRLPVDHPSWQTTQFHRPAELFMWEIGNSADLILFLGRFPTLILGVFVVALIGRFTHYLTRQSGAALIALLIAASDPNLLAHAALATTDFGLVAGAVCATFALWWWLAHPSKAGRAIVAGAVFALLQNIKFTAVLFIPLFACVIIGRLWPLRRHYRPLLLNVVLFGLSSFLTLWACYGFTIGRLSAELPAYSGLFAGRLVPFPHFIEQFADIGGRIAKATPAFLAGSYSDNGWWYYFPIAFLLKTPPFTLLGLVLAFFPTKALRSASTPHPLWLLFPSLGFFAIAMTNEINIGYRHILVVIPFLAIGIGRTMAHGWRRWLALIGITISLLQTSFIAPHFLAYFNPLAGGPEGGWRYLVDSNLDWGQSLHLLGDWMRQNGVARVYLSYFGEARPESADIAYIGLPSFPPRLMHPGTPTWAKDRPMAGYYAISATNLQGVLFDDHDLFAYFRTQSPIAKLGYSLFLYYVPPIGEPFSLTLGGVAWPDLSADEQAQLGGNQGTLHYFSQQDSLLLPATENNRPSFFLLDQPPTDPVFTDIIAKWQPIPTPQGRAFYRQTSPLEPSSWTTMATLFEHEAGKVQLLGYQLHQNETTRTLYTLWQNQSAESTPPQLFVHATNNSDSIIAQWDGWGVTRWQKGDHLIQRSELPLSAEITTLWIGLYTPETEQRWQTPHGDRLTIPLPSP